MRVITIMNLKGGVAKTTTAVNMAHILAMKKHLRVLLIDNDKQGNSSKFFGMYDKEKASISDVLLQKVKLQEAIRHTAYEGLDILPANMNLFETNNELAARMSPKTLRVLKDSLASVNNIYDIGIIDNPPDVNSSVLNALMATQEIIVPIVVDEFSFDGFKNLQETFEEFKEYNPSMVFRGCLINRYCASEEHFLTPDDYKRYKIFNTKIRRTEKAAGSTFDHTPIIEYSRRCAAAMDYIKFVDEYLEG